MWKSWTGLEFLLRCRDSNVIPNFLNFRVSSQTLKASLKYRKCQLKLLQKEIRDKESDIRILKKEFNVSWYNHLWLQTIWENELSLVALVRSFIKRQASGRYINWQQATRSRTTTDSKRHGMKVNGTTSGTEWLWVVQRVTTNESKWEPLGVARRCSVKKCF